MTNKTVWGWEHLNNLKPLWSRNPVDLTSNDYIEFYKSFFSDSQDPYTFLHFVGEGDTSFRSLIFIPRNPPFQLHSPDYEPKDFKLYVRRVFITDAVKELLPKYLSFLKGVLDADDLSLTVSREVLQKSGSLLSLKKRVFVFLVFVVVV